MNSLEDLELDVGLLHNISSQKSHMSPDSPSHPVPESDTPPIPWPQDMASPDPTPMVEARPSSLRHPRSAPLRTSPLNPSSHPPSPFARPRPLSSQFKRIPSEESRALSMIIPSSTNTPSRGSMILYRHVDPLDTVLFPPSLTRPARNSVISTSGDSYVSLSSDSKYPSGLVPTERGLVAYAYDPSADDQDPTDEDLLHDPEGKAVKSRRLVSWRGLKTLTMLLFLFACLLALFIAYPVIRFYRDDHRSLLIVGNARINSTGQADSVSFDPRSQVPLSPFGHGVATATPQEVRLRIGSDGEEYELVFADEFNVSGRSFGGGGDPIWHVDNALHDPRNIYTQNGYLVMKVNVTSPGGILRWRRPFCLNHGFVEVGVMSTERTAMKRIYWSGTWNFVDQDSGIVPNGSSLAETLSLELQFCAAVNDEGPSISASPASGEVMVDYVRVYQMKAQPASSCEDVIPPRHVHADLDVLDLL